MARDLVLGIEAVLPTAACCTAALAPQGQHGLRSQGAAGGIGRHARRDHGSELRLWPACAARPRPSSPSTPQHALELLGLLRAAPGIGSVPSSCCRASPSSSRRATGRRDRSTGRAVALVRAVRTELARHGAATEVLEQALLDAAGRGWAGDAAFASSERECAALWRLRESVPEAQRHASLSLKHDIAVPVASLPPFIQEARLGPGQVPKGCWSATATPGTAIFTSTSMRSRRARCDALRRMSPRSAAPSTISSRATRAVSAPSTASGRSKREELQRYAEPAGARGDAFDQAGADPHGIMNPGKLL